jgi:YYY domain-containing protein
VYAPPPLGQPPCPVVIEALRFLAIAELIGLAALPLAATVLGRLPGAGLGFAKPLGLLLVTWLVWIGGSLDLVAYTTSSAIVAIVVVALAGLVCALGLRRGPPKQRWWRAPRPAPEPPRPDPHRRPLLIGSELVFVVTFCAMALLVAYSPDVWNTEKPMDMGIVNALNQSRSFPPHDPWLAGADINYYYFGHLAMAIVVRLADVEPSRGYNLSIALLFALTASALFTLAGALWASMRAALPQLVRSPVIVGLVTVVAVLVLGNMAGGRELLQTADPPRGYDWFAPSRVVPGTINEFPWFSFLLADLHAHVLALPFTLLAAAFSVQVALFGPRARPRLRALLETLVAAISVGALYAINSWSYPVMAGVFAAALVLWLRDPASEGEELRSVRWGLLVLALSIVLVLPFYLSYDPAANGFGLVSDRRALGDFLSDQALLYGLFAALVAIAYAGRVAGSAKPWRNVIWLGVLLIVGGSLLAPLDDLAGVWGLALLLAVALHAALSRRLAAPERVLWLLISCGLACVLLPEVVYVRDAFDGSDLERMNTVFKFGYHAWLFLGLAGTLALFAAVSWVPRWLRLVWRIALVPLVLLALAYPWAGTYARKDGFKASPTLDGLGWLRATAPGDVEAIAWLRENAPGDAVVLEAAGPDYSQFGHARISTFTGLQTVIGWGGHEVQWEHQPGNRMQQVAAAYRTTDPRVARALIDKYGIDYVVVGPLERTEYGEAGVAKWDTLGRRVFDRDGTIVWDVRQAPGRS